MRGYQWQEESIILNVQIQPRASKDEWVGIHGDRIKVRITAPPVDGKANAHLLKFLAKIFSVPNKQVMLLSGQSSKTKRIRIDRPRTLPQELEAPAK